MNNDNIPPHNLEFEKAVLSCLINNSTNVTIDEVSMLLTDEDFYTHSNKIIYNAILELNKKNIAVDILTLSKILEDKKQIDEVGGRIGITEISSNFTNISQLNHKCFYLKELTLRRNLIKEAHNILGKVYSLDEDIFDLMDEFDTNIAKIKNIEGVSTNLKHIKESVDTAIKQLDKAMNEPIKVEGIETGFTNIDGILQGMKNGQSITIAARPAMAKTSLLTNILTNVAKKSNKAVLFFSLEMTNRELMLRIMSAESELLSHKIAQGNITSQDSIRVVEGLNKYYDTNLLIDDTADITPTKMRAIAKKVRRDYGGICLIGIDFVQIIKTKEKVQNRDNEISNITRDIKILAKEMDCPIITLSQLSRECEKRADKRPMLSDLRDSGTIEQNSDVVMFIHRPEYYGIQTFEDGESAVDMAEIIVAKNRGGNVGTIRLGFEGKYTRFKNLGLQMPSLDINPNKFLEPNREENQF